ncbi:MAG TPA: alanine--tRNA ligase [Tepidisphaeraceae bacterium]|jgi:alanyl-tRNA synthetase
MTSAEIRRAYIDFFVQKHAHTEVPSSPVVPHDDPTLLFTNAGMNQFKPIFLGQEKRAYTRAVDTQKCIRAGGKHNDLDDVGRSRRHHTFFEMLGNWSFGDYFKRGAIEMSWELLTKVFKLDPTRLHVTCFEGDPKNGVPRDTEAAKIWKEVAGLPDSHIHYFGKDNFWEMGDTGPCGPCTEIFYDRTPDKTGGRHVNGEDPRVMEIWNNVFIQYNRNADRSLTDLPAQHVDTGMGFERICQVLQDVDSNYSIDLWHPFWAKLNDLSGHAYSSKFPPTNSVDAAAEAADEGLRKDIAFRVIGDHVRCLTFALTDGAVPSNEGRGYVLRRILRRAVRFGRQSLGLKDPFLFQLVDVVVSSMGDAFLELKKNPQHVAELIKDEEVSFGRTLDRGIALFEEAAEIAGAPYELMQLRGPDVGPDRVPNRARATEHAKRYPSDRHPKPIISAEDAFKLHDTFGFPIDLTRIMAEERGFAIDFDGYEKLMEEARVKARAGGKAGDDAVFTLPPAALARLEADGVPRTDDSAKYAGQPTAARVAAVWRGDELISDVPTGVDIAVLLDKTCFYAEMGGQVGDTGTLHGMATSAATDPATFDVIATHAVGGYVLHIGRISRGTLRVGDTVTASVNTIRDHIQSNHTATHLLNWSLKKYLGDGVQQKGSLVDGEKLRFDFSQNKPLSEAELSDVETAVVQAISTTPLKVYTAEVPQEQALKINGLRAVFGEKYPPMVRVVSVGVPVEQLLAEPANEKWLNYSIEFCGGTHVSETKSIAQFAVVGEESVSKGVRRVTAVTGEKAADAWWQAKLLEDLVKQAESVDDAHVGALVASIQQELTSHTLPLGRRRWTQAKVQALQARAKAAEKAMRAAGGGVDAVAAAGQLLESAIDLGGGKIVVGSIDGATDDQLRSAIDSIRKKTGSYGVMLASAGEGKVSFIAAVSDDLIAKGLKSGDWIRETAKVAGGGGGGRPQMAQAGGKDPAKLPAALERAREVARTALAMH